MSQGPPGAETAPRSLAQSGQPAVPVIVKAGTAFEGLLSCPGASRIDGRFHGQIVAADRIELGENAEVSGRIEAQDIIVAGRFEGELVAHRSIELLATARVTGEFRARELVAEEGCAVEGRYRTGPASNAAE